MSIKVSLFYFEIDLERSTIFDFSGVDKVSQVGRQFLFGL